MREKRGDPKIWLLPDPFVLLPFPWRSLCNCGSLDTFFQTKMCWLVSTMIILSFYISKTSFSAFFFCMVSWFCSLWLLSVYVVYTYSRHRLFCCLQLSVCQSEIGKGPPARWRDRRSRDCVTSIHLDSLTRLAGLAAIYPSISTWLLSPLIAARRFFSPSQESGPQEEKNAGCYKKASWYKSFS